MNYKEVNISGYQWLRCSRVTIENQYKTPPVINLHEDVLTDIGEDHHIKPNRIYSVMFEPSKTFPVLNADTGEPTGAVMTHAEMYQLLWSLYVETSSNFVDPFADLPIE